MHFIFEVIWVGAQSKSITVCQNLYSNYDAKSLLDNMTSFDRRPVFYSPKGGCVTGISL